MSPLTMSSYDGSYYKVTTMADLPIGAPRVFRAAGAMVVVRRAQDGVTAIDGSCIEDAAHLSSEERLRRILDCVAAGAGSTSTEWDQLLSAAGLPVRVENDEVWVRIDSCVQ